MSNFYIIPVFAKNMKNKGFLVLVSILTVIVLVTSFVAAEAIGTGLAEPYTSFGPGEENDLFVKQMDAPKCENPLEIKGNAAEIAETFEFFFGISEEQKEAIVTSLEKEGSLSGKNICDVREFLQAFNDEFELGISDSRLEEVSSEILSETSKLNQKSIYDDNLEMPVPNKLISSADVSFEAEEPYAPFSHTLIGDTFVIAIFSDWESSTWTESTINEGVSTTVDMIDWMESVAPAQANLNMYGVAYQSYSTTEPLNFPNPNVWVWGDEAVRNLGFTDLNNDGSAIDDMMELHRGYYDTDNVFVIFLSYMRGRSYAIGDYTQIFAIEGCFFIFCPLEEFPLYAHETLHLFGAQDEYYATDGTGCQPYSCTAEDKWGYINGNCENPVCGLDSVPCVMKYPWEFGDNPLGIEYYSRGQVGWGDHDADNLLDPLDNCMWDHNPDQSNYDSDLYGDACDVDDDNDGSPDFHDACPFSYGAYCNGCGEITCENGLSSSCPADGPPVCNDETCTPDWDCSEWSSCVGSTKSRTCVDENECNTNTGKPPEYEECEELDFSLNSPQTGFYDQRKLLFDLETSEIVDRIEYIDFTDRSPKYKTLCKNCDSYYGTKNLGEGNHSLGFRAVVDETSGFKLADVMIDSKDPKITKLEPNKGFTNGQVTLKFQEENPAQVIFYYGNYLEGYRSYTMYSGYLPEICDVDKKGNWACELDSYFGMFDGSDIEYWVEINDLAGNSEESKHYKLTADTTLPQVINPLSYWEQGIGKNNKYLYFDFEITEENFDEISYTDWTDRTPREKRLCSRLKNGVCEVKKSFSKGEHELTIKVLDKAGNYVEDEIEFSVV